MGHIRIDTINKYFLSALDTAQNIVFRPGSHPSPRFKCCLDPIPPVQVSTSGFLLLVALKLNLKFFFY